MKHSLLLGLLLGLSITVLLGAAAQLTTTNLTLQSTKDATGAIVAKQSMMMRCDNSTSLSASGALGGETCESGDWSAPLDCRGYSHFEFYVNEYGAGSGDFKLWNCYNIQATRGASASTAGASFPGTEDPSGSPSASDPDPLCVDLTASLGVTIDGTTTGTQFVSDSDIVLGFLVAEVNTCTGNCDSTVIVSCSQ